MDGSDSTPTPMVGMPALMSDADSPLSDAREYRSIIGSLLYAYYTRPNIAFSLNKLAQYMHQSCEQHLVAVKRVLCYLNGTLDYSFCSHHLPLVMLLQPFQMLNGEAIQTIGAVF
ncbi:hypothetical protein HRI_001231300 [Hibiscus trionum]|uniref:Reverse transcriptase Ty1/copia-type domain-containing protein n=1 Tax=Hibiscus trionum TaxID=183268 RepID=A0A9W7LUE9_HIBTR|nr:hypothetical protein HRI_001231300 [Hibiscus trionum]